MTASTFSFVPGPFFEASYHSDPVAKLIWRFLNEIGFIRQMTMATMRGLPALEAGQEELAGAFEELQAGDARANLLKSMTGRMACQIMQREGFDFERGGVPISDPILFLTAARYRSRN